MAFSSSQLRASPSPLTQTKPKLAAGKRRARWKRGPSLAFLLLDWVLSFPEFRLSAREQSDRMELVRSLPTREIAHVCSPRQRHHYHAPSTDRKQIVKPTMQAQGIRNIRNSRTTSKISVELVWKLNEIIHPSRVWREKNNNNTFTCFLFLKEPAML